MKKYICIHAHLYQPPRENPWLEEVELQDSAIPYHDWNERITAECYAPNTAARILGAEDRIVEIVNNYTRISFNFGPTLLSWMERHHPETYQAILEADRLSQRRFSGHGSALGQVYNHLIMPLANRRDKETQIVWGIRDFESRFGRQPEGMWLSETAVDLETLDLLAEHGIRFTILAAHQAHRTRPLGDSKWLDVGGSKVDPRMPYTCALPSGRSIALFFYDNPIAHDIAFGDLLNRGENLAHRLLQPFDPGCGQPAQLVHIATDGETYGHHRRYGEMALAFCLHYLEKNQLAEVTIYGEYLDRHPPTHEVAIYENTSWSCFHGVDRWRANCGCNSGMHPGWTQAWRAPLRDALDYLRDELSPLFESALNEFGTDPWAARNGYIDVILDRSPETVEAFFARHAGRTLEKKDKTRWLKLLELQRHAQLMYTSCGWFFDEISGIETAQIMQYAARVIQLARDLWGISLEAGFRDRLRHAPSNQPEYGNGEKVWEDVIRPGMIDLFKVGAHYAVSSMFEDYEESRAIYCYSTEQKHFDREVRGEQKIVVGQVIIRSDITWEERNMAFAVLHLGDHNLVGGVRPFLGEQPFDIMRQEVREAFNLGDIPEIIRLMDDHFGMHSYTLWHLFKDEQRKVLDIILATALRESEDYLRHIYEHYYPIIQVMNKMHVPLPKILSTTVEFILNQDINQLLEDEDFNSDKLRRLATEMSKWDFKRDKTTLAYATGRSVTRLMERLSETPEDTVLVRRVQETLEILKPLALDMDVWKAQNLYHTIDRQIYQQMHLKAANLDPAAQTWVSLFDRLGQTLRVARS